MADLSQDAAGANRVEGAALVCGGDDVVRLLRDEIGLVDTVSGTSSFVDLLDSSSREKGALFLAEARTNGAAFDWELGVRVGAAIRLLHFAAAANDDGDLVIVAATTRASVLQYYDELMRINNEQANALRMALKKTFVSEPARDAAVYDEMMKLNNELATLQRELTRKNMELQRANNLKNQFVGMAAHDLRNPIGAIRSLSMLLLDADIPLSKEQENAFLHRIVSSSEFMLKLINDLLDISIIESGQLRLDAREMDVQSVLRGSVELNRLIAEEKRIAITLDIREALPTIIADAGKIEQVLQNLIGNAVKFSPFGSTVLVRAETDGEGVLISVVDQGPGIPEAEIAGIFNAFQKATPRGTGGERSTGLGLAIAKRIMDGHAGRLWCETVLTHGSTFHAWLPLRGNARTGSRATSLSIPEAT